MKSLYNLILTDSNEQFTNRSISMSGVENVLGQAYSLVAGSLDIPVTRFLGTSAKGLNATGEGDIRNYYDNIGSRQDSDLRPILDWMDAWVQMNDGKEPEILMYEFPSLWQEDESEKETRLNARADRDLKYLSAGVIDEGHILKEIVSDGVYSFVDQEYVDGFTEALEDIEHEAVQEGGIIPGGEQDSILLNGAQIKSASEVAAKLSLGEMGIETASVLLSKLGVSSDEVDKILKEAQSKKVSAEVEEEDA